MLPLTAIKTILTKLIRNVKLTTDLTQIYAKTNNPVTNVESRKSLIFLLNGLQLSTFIFTIGPLLSCNYGIEVKNSDSEPCVQFIFWLFVFLAV